MKGYPSARVRVLQPPIRISPHTSPVRGASKSVSSGPGVATQTKVDAIGFMIDHQRHLQVFPRKKSVNHKMPDFDKVYPKVDSRGIDIPKWRNSILNLRYNYKHIKQTSKISGDDMRMSVEKIYF